MISFNCFSLFHMHTHTHTRTCRACEVMNIMMLVCKDRETAMNWYRGREKESYFEKQLYPNATVKGHVLVL